MKIAAAACPIEWHSRWSDYVGKLRLWVRTARDQGAELLVFPEYGAMEVASLAGERNAADLVQSVDAVNARLGDIDDLHASLAREFGVHICAASAPVRREPAAAPVNRARFFAPDGSRAYQDKQIMTRFERYEWGIVSGEGLRVFETALGRLGILICYDAEFPLLARALVEAGIDILMVPSCTDTMHGYNRVRIAAMARALEGQIAVAQAVTLGEAGWLAAADRNFGAAGIFAPPDGPFPETGVVAAGKPGEPGWVFGEIDLEALRKLRSDGAVLNRLHWGEQDDRPAAGVDVVTVGTA
jgi:predicted amidohydrolase